MSDDGLSEGLLPPRFEQVRLLGRGGMGTVFLARDRVLFRHVAIKILAPELAADPVARERFAREATLAGRLGAHPHIVTAFDAGEWEERPYVVFEYMPNGSLAEQLQDGATPPRPEALRWLAQAAAALDHAHAENVVHRDIKPANLLLDADENLSVADFGVSRSDGETTLTAHGEVVGTAGYLAPEQVDGRGATAASDRFALGVVAYQLLTGRLPSAGHRDLAARVFDRALAEQPERRYPTATAFVDALRATLAADPEPTLVAPTRRRLLPERTTPGARPVAASPAPARHRQRSRAWRTAVLLLVALAIAAPATAGGMVLGRRLAGTHPSPSSAPRALATRCAVSPFAADANLVVYGVGAIGFCRSQAEALSTPGDAWAYRANTHLLAPDSGHPADLGRICALARGQLTAQVYDDLGRRIGTNLCHSYAAAGWELRS